MPNIDRSPLQTFKRITEILAGDLYSEEMIKQTSIALHGHYCSKLDTFPTFTDLSDNADAQERVKTLMEILHLIDVDDKFSPFILDHPEDDCDDFEDVVQLKKLSTDEGFIYRMISLNAYELGTSFSLIGNNRIGLHMVLLAIAIQERVIRLTPRTASDERISYLMYERVLRIGFKVQRHDSVVEYGHKLAHKLEVALNGIAETPSKVSALMDFDFANHFENLMILAASAKEAGQVSIVTYAYEQAIELFSIEKRFARECAILESIKNSTSSISEIANILKDTDKEGVLLFLCLELVKANETAGGELLLSLNYSRCALEHFSLSQSSEVYEESHLQFLCGRLIYKHALYLAGGQELASSPPIAVLPPSNNQPTIKNLLEESLDMLEDASKTAKPGKGSACQEAVLLQTAIVSMELRMEHKTRAILTSLGLSTKELVQIDESIRQKNGQYPEYAEIIYSPEVLKRILLAVSEQPGSKKLTLSRKRTMNFDLPQKVLCSYCSMQCINTDLKCEECAPHRVFVWYCTEECRQHHLPQHQSQCLKNKSDKGIDFKSFLNVLG